MLRLIVRMFKWLIIGPAPAPAPSPSPVIKVPAPAPAVAAPPPVASEPGPDRDRDDSPDGAAPFILEPANGWIIVQRQERESVSPGGIVIPDAAKELNVKVMVLAVSRPWVNDHGHLQRSGYRAGDFLVISRYAGQQLVIDHGRIQATSLRESDVIARIRIARDADHIPDAVCLPAEKRDADLQYQADTMRHERYDLSRNGA